MRPQTSGGVLDIPPGAGDAATRPQRLAAAVWAANRTVAVVGCGRRARGPDAAPPCADEFGRFKKCHVDA